MANGDQVLLAVLGPYSIATLPILIVTDKDGKILTVFASTQVSIQNLNGGASSGATQYLDITVLHYVQVNVQGMFLMVQLLLLKSRNNI